MPLIGDLAHIPLRTLFDILAAGRKTGTLTLSTSREKVEVFLRRGRVQQAWLTKGPSTCEALLVAKVPQEDRDLMRALARGNDTAAILLLDYFGLSSRDDTVAFLREQTQEALAEVAGWRRAEFRFEESATTTGKVDVGAPFELSLREPVSVG